MVSYTKCTDKILDLPNHREICMEKIRSDDRDIWLVSEIYGWYLRFNITWIYSQNLVCFAGNIVLP